MKALINKLFTKDEIIDRKHEQINERTMKIKGSYLLSYHDCFHIQIHVLEALKVCFFDNNDARVDAFWDNQGKIIRGNQRRGRSFREKHAT